MKAIGRFGLMIVLTVVATARASYFDQNFDGYPLGQTFHLAAYDGWRASSAGVIVTDASANTPAQSVLLPESAVFSNRVGVANPGAAWTDFRVRPTFGELPPMIPSSTASFALCFATNRYLSVFASGGWRSCTNDIWGNALPALTTNWVDVSVYQNYASTSLAVFVDGRLALQDLNFAANPGAYNDFVAVNVDSNAFLDDVYITNAYPSARLTLDNNTNGIADGLEVHSYGYAGRIFEVGLGKTYATLQAGVNAARPLDRLFVYGNTNYNENVTIASDVTFIGQAFTNSGNYTVSGATLSFTNLAMAPASQIAVTGGRLVVVGAGVDMTGTFTISAADWGSAAVATLPFTEDFEPYAAGSLLRNLGFRGWGASGSGAVVVAGPVAAGARAAAVSGSVSNRVNGSAALKVWTDLQLRPVLGDPPDDTPGGNTSFSFFVTTNGRPAYFDSGWRTILTNAVGGAFTPMTAGAYARVTLFENFTTHYAALFLNGTLLVQRVNVPVSTFSGMRLLNADGLAYMDNVQISTLAPPTNLLADIDLDGWNDAQEIHDSDYLGARSFPASVFTFR